MKSHKFRVTNLCSSSILWILRYCLYTDRQHTNISIQQQLKEWLQQAFMTTHDLNVSSRRILYCRSCVNQNRPTNMQISANSSNYLITTDGSNNNQSKNQTTNWQSLTVHQRRCDVHGLADWKPYLFISCGFHINIEFLSHQRRWKL